VTTVLALALVGLGSLAYRSLPLLGASRLPEQVSQTAGWAGIAVLAAVTVRGVLNHRDDSTPWAVPVAVISVTLGLLLATRGRAVPVVLAVGAMTYLVLSAAVGTWAG
jgi:branched-subunit amino acid transport protein